MAFAILTGRRSGGLLLLSREFILGMPGGGGLPPYRHWSSLSGPVQACLALLVGSDPAGRRGRWRPCLGVVRPGLAIMEMYWS